METERQERDNFNEEKISAVVELFQSKLDTRLETLFNDMKESEQDTREALSGLTACLQELKSSVDYVTTTIREFRQDMKSISEAVKVVEEPKENLSGGVNGNMN